MTVYTYISHVLSITEKSPPNASQLKESMDLYEEIVTEEQQSRESTYLEVSCHARRASIITLVCDVAVFTLQPQFKPACFAGWIMWHKHAYTVYYSTCRVSTVLCQ